MVISNLVKILAVSSLVLGVSVAAFAQEQQGNGSIVSQLRNDEAVASAARTPGHGRHDTDGDGDDDHMDGRNGNGYGHSNGGRNGGGNGGNGGHGGGDDCPPVPEPATMATLGVGAGIMALKRRRAAKKQS